MRWYAMRCIGGACMLWLAWCLFAAAPVQAAPPDAPAAAAPASRGDTGPPPASPSPSDSFEEPIPARREIAPPGAVIGEIVIRNENIFDTADPREDNWLFRLANAIHVKTRPWVIRGQLLFRTGDPYDPRLLEESERLLRSNRFFYDVWIRPIAVHDDRVDVEVVTRDVWTLRPGFAFGRAGGANTVSFNIEELNFLGTGVGLGASKASTPDRNIASIYFSAPRIADTWIRAEALVSQNSDGWTRAGLIERPFYALNTHWAGGAGFVDNVSVETLVGTVTVASEFQQHLLRETGWAGWSAGLVGRWVKRYTLGFTRDFSWFAPAPGVVPSGSIPPDRKLAYPWVGFQVLENSFETARNLDQIVRTEDLYLGTFARASLGYSDSVFGADRTAAIFSGGFGTSFRPATPTTILVDTAADGRFEDSSVQNTIVGANGHSYVRLSDNWLFYSLLSAKWGINLDPDQQLLLGGDTGLRGYPRKYQAGDRTALLTMEGRYYTALYPFRLFRIGAAAFYDMGRAWGGDFVNPASGVLRDVGAGLRIALARSGHGGVIHVDLAFPLDGDSSIARMQVLVKTKVGF